MGLTFKLSDLSPSGQFIDLAVGASELELSSDEGTVIGDLRFCGTLSKPDEDTVYFQGKISGKMARECVRCLAVFQDEVDLPCFVLFKKSSASGKGERKHEDMADQGDEAFPILGNQVELLPVLREQIILATPIRPLCKDQCLGLCQVCGANMNDETCECHTPVLPSEGGLHPDVSMLGKRSASRFPGSRHQRRPLKKS